MAYSSTNPPICISDVGFGTAAPRTFFYGSTHLVADIVATGFFAGCFQGSRSNDASNIGLRTGDLVINRSSTSSAAPGRVTMHSVIGATANQASTTASTGWLAVFNASVSTT
jgi:hypothetical protein